MMDEEKQSLNTAQVQLATCEEFAGLLGMRYTYRICGIDEPNTWKSSLDQQVTVGGSRKLHYLNKSKFRKK
ncbi:hypothetical protein ACFXTI_041261 [Malus domestica]